MKKKTYIKSEIRVVNISLSNILAGSGDTDVKPDDKTTEDQYSKENKGYGLWDEDE